MLSAIKQRWREFKKAKPGERFEARYERRRGADGLARKILMIAGGIALIIVGVLFLAIPGPGIPILLIGAGMLAQESRSAARALDSMELAIVRTVQRFREKRAAKE